MSHIVILLSDITYEELTQIRILDPRFSNLIWSDITYEELTLFFKTNDDHTFYYCIFRRTLPMRN